MRKILWFAVLCLGLSVQADDSALSQHLLSMADYTNGIAVMPQADADGGLVAALATNSGFLVYAQHTNAAVVQAVATLADSEGLLNRTVYVSQGAQNQVQMPGDYADFLAMTKLTDAELAGGLLVEIRRVASPNGLVVLGAEGGTGLTQAALTNWLVSGGVTSYSVTNDSFGLWARFSEPRDSEEDDWAYWYHGSDGNPVSTDTALKFPYLSQFYSAPFHGASPNCTVMANGRVFRSMGVASRNVDFGEAVPDHRTIEANNGYNGQMLWRHIRPVATTEKQAYAATADTYYLLETNRVLVLDAATGTEQNSIVFSNGYVQPKWMAIHGNTVIVLKGDPDNPVPQVGVEKYEYNPWGANYSPWGAGRELAAYDLTTGTQVWSHVEPSLVDSRNVALSEGRIFYNAPSTNWNAVSSNLTGRVGCLDADDGSLLWTNIEASVIADINAFGGDFGHVLRRPRHGMMVYSNRVTIWRPGSSNVVALSTGSGTFSWKHPLSGTSPHLFGLDGNIWGKGLLIGGSQAAFILDLATGAKTDSFGVANAGCARYTVSPDAMYTAGGRGRDQATDTATSNPLGFKSGCNEGTVPANGSLYSTPTVCRCNVSARGFVSARYAGDDFVFAPTAGVDRLTVTTNQLSSSLNIMSSDWPQYRKNNQRSAATAVAVGTATNTLWTYVPDHKNIPTAIAVADGRAVFGGSDGKVRCLDSGAGTQQWAFATGGRIMAAPTLWSNRVYVTSGDGYLYTLDAGNGNLLWKYRLAPYERKIMIYGHLSSTWPANSGALIHSGRVYAAAGMCDWDGAHVYALDAIDGTLIWQNSDDSFVDADEHKGFGVYGGLTLQNGKLWMPGGNYCSPISFDLDTGACDPGDLGFKTALRGREIGAYADGHVLFGGKMLYGRTNEWSGMRGESVHFQYLNTSGARDGNPVSSTDGSNVRAGIFPAWDDEITIADVGSSEKLAGWDTTQMVARLMQERNNSTTAKEGVPAVWSDDASNPAQLWQNADQSLYGIVLASDEAVVTYANNLGYGELPTSFWVSGVSRTDGFILWTKTLDSEPMVGLAAVSRSGAVLIPMVDGTIVALNDPDNTPMIIATASGIDVAEGATNTFGVSLSLMPDSPATVTVTRASGSASLERVGTANLVFNSSNWNSNQWVLIEALQDPNYTNDEAVFTMSSSGLPGTSVTVTQLDDETDPNYALPFTETFEDLTPGTLAGQHGWSGGGTVQSGTARDTQALSLTNETVSHTFADNPTNVWVTLWAQPVFSEVAADIPSNAVAPFYVNTNAQVVAYSNTTPITITTPTVSNGWNKFEAFCDYSSKVWKLSLNGTELFDDFEFYTDQAAFSAFELVEGTADNSYFDDLEITDSKDDADADGLPDSWEEEHFGGDVEPDATASNGVNTVLQCYIAGLDPNDSAACFELSSCHPLQWAAASGRVYTVWWTSNLLSGFQPLESNYTGGAYTDLTHDADNQGFYKIDVRIE